MSKPSTVILVALLVTSSVIMVECVSAELPKPSVPEFTLSITDYSYDVQTTTTTRTDPYDGRVTTTTAPGYHVKNGTVTLTIKNQPFTPYYNSDGYPIKLYYHIRMKAQSGSDWHYSPQNTPKAYNYFEADNSSSTTIIFTYKSNLFGAGDVSYYGGFVYGDGQIDFQVEAFIGYCDVTNIDPSSLVVRPDDLVYDYVGQTSGWSNTQTVAIGNAPTSTWSPPDATPTPTPATPYVAPQNPTEVPPQNPTAMPQDANQMGFLADLSWEQAALVAMAGVIVGLVLVVAVLWRKVAAKNP